MKFFSSSRIHRIFSAKTQNCRPICRSIYSLRKSCHWLRQLAKHSKCWPNRKRRPNIRRICSKSGMSFTRKIYSKCCLHSIWRPIVSDQLLSDKLFNRFFSPVEKQMGFYTQILFNHISRAVVFVPNSVTNDLLSELSATEALALEPIDKSYHLLTLKPQNENLLNILCPLLVNSHLPIAVSSHQILLK